MSNRSSWSGADIERSIRTAYRRTVCRNPHCIYHKLHDERNSYSNVYVIGLSAGVRDFGWAERSSMNRVRIGGSTARE